MMETKKWCTVLRNRKNLESFIPQRIKNETDLYLVESMNQDTLVEEILLVYDCTKINTPFQYKHFLEVIDRIESVFQPVVVFKNWDQERKKYWEYYDTLKKASEKKEFSEWFDTKISIYTDASKFVSLAVEEDGINYLEYSNGNLCPENQLHGYVYNISFFELKKLFNVTGVHLFSSNVRYGLKKQNAGEVLKIKFREYLINAIYNKVTTKCTEEEKEKVEDIFAAQLVSGFDQEASQPENFWFYHNGISIFCCTGSTFDSSANILKLPPDKVSVINGAQTLTNFYGEAEFVERSFIKEIEQVIPLPSQALMDEVMNEIYVKTVIITGSDKYIRPITYGLNTQIPILEETLLADSKIVENINQILIQHSKSKMKIIKEGEPWGGDRGLSVLDFAKHWLTIHNEPGRSKNLGKKQLQELMESIYQELQSDTSSIEKLELLLTVYQWWEESRNCRLNNNGDSEIYATIGRYGKNYFGTYVCNVLSPKEGIDESELIFQYENFVHCLDLLGEKLELGDFKMDNLTKKMLLQMENMREAQEEQEETIITEDMLAEIKALLNRENQSPYTFSKTISQYLTEKNVKIEYFRVLSMADGKCKEAFPFPNATFTELTNQHFEEEDIVQDVPPDEEDEKDNQKPYWLFEDSLFHHYVTLEFPVFVIKQEKEATNNHVVDVEFIEYFTFSHFIEEAERTYYQTIQAFQEGQEALFPRAGDGMGFHIRPKAANAKNTFEFTNGDYIVKRTFWANKETVELCLEFARMLYAI